MGDHTQRLRPVSVTLAPAQVGAADRLARRLRRTRSYIVREALDRFLAEVWRPAQRAAEIGSGDGGGARSQGAD